MSSLNSHPLFARPVMLKQVLIMVGLQLLAIFAVQSWWSIAWLVVGGLIGLGLLRADEKFLLPYYRADEADSQLITRSPLFIMAFAVVALFVLTSSDQYVGFGVVFGLSVGLLVEGWQLARRPAEFAEWFGVHTSPSHQDKMHEEATGELLPDAPAKPINEVMVMQILVAATSYAVLLFGWWLIGR